MCSRVDPREQKVRVFSMFETQNKKRLQFSKQEFDKYFRLIIHVDSCALPWSASHLIR